MKRFLLIILFATPLPAQTTATIFLTSQHNTGSGIFPFEDQNLTIDFDNGGGADVRYIPLRISGRPAPDDDRIEADVDPLFVSAGLRIRF